MTAHRVVSRLHFQLGYNVFTTQIFCGNLSLSQASIREEIPTSKRKSQP
jgi:hypothetical protein